MVEFDRSAPLDERLGRLVYELLEADDGSAAGRRPDREPALGRLHPGYRRDLRRVARETLAQPPDGRSA
jgi:hypothetical protein